MLHALCVDLRCYIAHAMFLLIAVEATFHQLITASKNRAAETLPAFA